MANKQLEIHPAALAEFKSAVLWYMERNQIAPTRFVAEVDRAIDLLLESPARWPAAELGTRRMILRRFPYAIMYRDGQNAIQILAVAHGHRQPGY